MAGANEQMTVSAYWGDVVRRGCLEALDTIGQSPVQLAYWLLAVVVMAALLWSREGAPALRTHMKNTLTLAGIAVLAWLPFFVYQLGSIAHKDYMEQLRRAAGAEAKLAEEKEPKPQAPAEELAKQNRTIDALENQLASTRRELAGKDHAIAERNRAIQRQDHEIADLRTKITDLTGKADDKERRKHIRLGLSACFEEGERRFKRAAATASQPVPSLDGVDVWINKCARWIKDNLPDASYFVRFVNPEIDKGDFQLIGPGMTEERSRVYRIASRYTAVLNRFMDEFR